MGPVTKTEALIGYFTASGLDWRLGEGLRLQVGDIDAVLGRVDIRDSKSKNRRLVPLPEVALNLLRSIW